MATQITAHKRRKVSFGLCLQTKPQWLTPSGYNAKQKRWAPMCGVSFVLFTTFLDKKLLPGKIGMACYAISHFFFCLTAVFFLLVLFQKHLNFTTRLLGNLPTNSSAIYFILYFVILWVILVLRELQGNAFVEWLLVGILSVTISYLVARYALSKTHIFSATVRSIQGSR
jgi:hypothetical protein